MVLQYVYMYNIASLSWILFFRADQWSLETTNIKWYNLYLVRGFLPQALLNEQQQPIVALREAKK